MKISIKIPKHLAPKVEKLGDLIRLDQMTDPYFPPLAPGRGKRQTQADGYDLVFRMASAAFRSGTTDEVLTARMNDAIQRGDVQFFKVIAAAGESANFTRETKFSRNVRQATIEWYRAKHITGETLTKAEIIELVCDALGDDAFGPTDYSRWTEVFRVAGIATEIPQAKPIRGKARNAQW